MTTYEKVYAAAKAQGLSIKQLSEKVGVSDATIYTWKRKGTPNGSTLQKIADTLNVSVDYLLGNTDEKRVHSIKDDQNKNEVDLIKVANEDSWDEYLSANGKPLSDQDKKVLRALFGDD